MSSARPWSMAAAVLSLLRSRIGCRAFGVGGNGHGYKPEEGRSVGRVIWFSRAKGYGFIRFAVENGKDVFVHSREVVGGAQLYPEDVVEFFFEMGRNGWRARQVVRIGGGS